MWIEGYGFLWFSRKYRKQLLDAGLDALKTVLKQVVHKEVEATGQVVGNEIAEKTVKPKHRINQNPRNVEEIVTPPEKKGRNIERIKIENKV